MEDSFVNPGDRLSMEEEYAPAANTYVEDGVVYAAATGSKVVKDGAVGVAPLRQIKRFDRGMSVLGRVTDNMKSVVFVAIDRVSSGNSEYVALKDGKIVIRPQRQFDRRGGRPPYGGDRMGGRGGDSEEKPCRMGDTIIARVIAEENDIYMLGFGSPESGVVYSLCSVCNGPLQKGERPDTLNCPDCRRSEHKKLSVYFGKPEEIKKYFENIKLV